MKNKDKKNIQLKEIPIQVQHPLPEEISFFSIKSYIIVVAITLLLVLVPPLVFEFDFDTLFTKYGLWYVAYYLFMAVISYRMVLFFVKINYSKHLEKISDATKRVANGDFSVKLELDKELKENSYINIMFNDFNTMVAELNSIETLKSDFIANVSHEIKTPISIINNYSTALKDESLNKDERNEYIKTIIETTEKLSQLVANVLKLSKIENKKISNPKESYDLSRQLSECVLAFEDVLEKKNIDFYAEMEDRVIIKENANDLEIIWNNLLSNAFKFTEPYKSVVLTQKSTDEFVIVSIKDSGCGFDDKTKLHIFDKFYQGETSHTEEGNGLGLALVQKIAELNGYIIEVNSEVGKGAEFTVKIKQHKNGN